MTVNSIGGLFFFKSIIRRMYVQMTSFFKAKFFKHRSKQNTAFNLLSCLFVMNLKERLEQELITTFGTKSIWGLLDLVRY